MNFPRPLVSIVLVAGSLLAGCAKIPPTHYYVLSTPAPPHTTIRKGLRVGVQPFRVNPPYDQDRIVYRVGSESPEVGFYAYHRWAAPLGRMLPGAVSLLLESGNPLASFEPAMPDRNYAAILDGHLLLLEEVDTPAEQQARLRLSLVLRSSAGEELWSASVFRSVSGQAEGVDEIVLQMRTALEGALRQMRPGITAALQSLRRSAGAQERP